MKQTLLLTICIAVIACMAVPAYAYDKPDCFSYEECLQLAGQGDAEAQLNLGTMYIRGRGVPQDFSEAYAWFNISATQGNVSAINKRDIVAKELLSAEDLKKAKALSKEYYKKYVEPFQ